MPAKRSVRLTRRIEGPASSFHTAQVICPWLSCASTSRYSRASSVRHCISDSNRTAANLRHSDIESPCVGIGILRIFGCRDDIGDSHRILGHDQTRERRMKHPSVQVALGASLFAEHHASPDHRCDPSTPKSRGLLSADATRITIAELLNALLGRGFWHDQFRYTTNLRRRT